MSLLRHLHTFKFPLRLLGLDVPSTVPPLRDAFFAIFSLSSSCQPSTLHGSEYEQIRQIVLSFLDEIDYVRPNIPVNLHLVEDVLSELKSWEINDGRPWKFYVGIAEHSAGMAELGYHRHPYTIKKLIAMFTVFMLYMDDLADRMPEALADFQRRMIVGLPQQDPVLEHFPSILTAFYDFYDPLCANSIVAAAFEYVTGTALETRTEMEALVPHPDATSWPNFLRAKTGVAPAYGYMIFFGERHRNIAHFLQTIPDINTFIDLTNDVLSFYKEERAGETNNYMHNYSRCKGTDAHTTCANIAKECTVLDERISKVSSTTDSKTLEAWQTFKTGYITFHVSLPRYKLVETGI